MHPSRAPTVESVGDSYRRAPTFSVARKRPSAVCDDVRVVAPLGPHADRRVRLAAVGDARAIALIQGRAWQEGYTGLLPPEASNRFDAVAAAGAWTAAIDAPPSRHHRVLVAVAGADVVGFAAYAPATDADLDDLTDAELVAMHVAAEHQRQGHGSRLMAAVVEHARDDGFLNLTTWVFAADDPFRLFLREHGWAPDGSTRDLDVGELLHQVRLATVIGPDAGLLA
jgi:GNAT superfamily N-acetyltransferase